MRADPAHNPLGGVDRHLAGIALGQHPITFFSEELYKSLSHSVSRLIE